MSISYTTRAGKGSPLSAVEHDANLENIVDAIENTSTGHDHDGTDSKKIAVGSLDGTLPISQGGTGQVTAATAFAALKQAATTSATGVVELATNAEVVAGADTSRAITPAGLAAKIGVYDIHEVSEFPDDYTAAGLALLDDTNAAAQRTTLGLGTIATQNANNVNISGGAVAGITDLAIADGGTGASTAATARTALGVAIGVDVMAYEAWPIHEVEELCSVD